jgi:hypothetical protein
MDKGGFFQFLEKTHIALSGHLEKVPVLDQKHMKWFRVLGEKGGLLDFLGKS